MKDDSKLKTEADNPDETVPEPERLMSPDGSVHTIVPEGVQALINLGWTRVDN